jgi:hypothetical protein
MFDFEEIKQRVLSGNPVSEKEYAYLLRHNKAAFFAFMIRNNPGSVNNVLRHELGYTELPFAPDLKKMARIIGMMIEKGEANELHTLLSNFKLDLSKVTPELQSEIEGIYDTMPEENNSAARTAQEIAGDIGNSIGGFLNPIFGSSTTTTVTSPSPTSSSKGGAGVFVAIAVVLVIAAVAFFGFKNN